MDIRTGRLYDTREDALAAGVPASDIAEVVTRRDGTYWPKFTNTKYPRRHQGSRETARRQKLGEAHISEASKGLNAPRKL